MGRFVALASVARVLCPIVGIALFAILWGSGAGCNGESSTPSPVETKPAAGLATQAIPAATRVELAGPGGELFLKHCAACHGSEGNRIPAARLDSKRFLDALGQTGFTTAVAEGKGIMPPFAAARGGPLEQEDILTIQGSLLAASALLPEPSPTVSSAATPAKAKTQAALAGFVERGRELYDTNCTRCHAEPWDIAGNATPVKVKEMGPDLTFQEASLVFEYLKSLATAQATPSTAKATATAGVALSAIEKGEPPMDVPHRTAGREYACLECHGPGRVSPFPINHGGRTNDMCLLCHMTGPLPSPVTHEVKGREDQCQVCHSIGGIFAVPSNHIGRGNETCTLCHEGVVIPPQSEVARTIPPITHLVPSRASLCRECHRQGGLGDPVPSNHSGLTDKTCMMCHIAVTAGRSR